MKAKQCRGFQAVAMLAPARSGEERWIDRLLVYLASKRFPGPEVSLCLCVGASTLACLNEKLGPIPQREADEFRSGNLFLSHILIYGHTYTKEAVLVLVHPTGPNRATCSKRAPANLDGNSSLPRSGSYGSQRPKWKEQSLV